MRILSIDPGPVESAYVLMDGSRLIRFGKDANANVSILFRDGLCLQAAICERIRSMGMPAGAELFETCEWCGRFWQIALDQNIPWHWIERREEKMNLCGSMRAKDANIRQAVMDRFGGKSATKKDGPLHGVSGDVWSALAVALTWQDQRAVEGVRK